MTGLSKQRTLSLVPAFVWITYCTQYLDQKRLAQTIHAFTKVNKAVVSCVFLGDKTSKKNFTCSKT